MPYYTKKIIITPVINPPHPEDLTLFDNIPNTNMNFTESQEYFTDYQITNMDICSFQANFNSGHNLSLVKNNQVDLQEFKFKPRLNNASLKQFEFKPKLKNTSVYKNKLDFDRLRNKENNLNDLIPNYGSQNGNIRHNSPPIQSMCTESNIKCINDYKLQNVGTKSKKFKFDKNKNKVNHSGIEIVPEREIHEYNNSFNLLPESKNNPIKCSLIENNLKSIENSTHNFDKNSIKSTVGSSKYINNYNDICIDSKTNNYNNEPKENFEFCKSVPDSDPDHNTPNSEEWFTHIPKELEQILDHSTHRNNCSSENNSKIHENEKSMNPYINILDLKTLDQIDFLSNLGPNNSEHKTCDEICQNNNDKCLKNESEIVQNMESLLTETIQTQDHDINILNRIDDLINLCSNSSNQQSKKNKEQLKDSLQNNTRNKSILESNEQEMTLDNNTSSEKLANPNNVSKTDLITNNKSEKTEINENIDKDYNTENSKSDKIIEESMKPKLLIANDNIKININNNVHLANPDVSENYKQTINFQGNDIDKTGENKLSDNINIKNLSNVNQIASLTLNNHNQMEENKFQKYGENKYSTENTKINKNSILNYASSIKTKQTKILTKELIIVKPKIPINKQSKTIRRKNYTMEIDKICTTPQPKTIQTKITTLLKPTKKSPDAEGNNSENANKNNNCVLKSCLEICAGKRKITDHFPVIKESITSKDKKLKTSNTEHSAEEKKQVPKFKKNKFIAPFIKEKSQENIKYEICTLNDDNINILENYLSATCPDEITFNVIFKENCCLLSQTQTGNMMYNPIGIMIHISWSPEIKSKSEYPVFYYIKLSKSFWKDIYILRTLLNNIFTKDCQKICFKAQSLIILLMDVFSFSIDEIELNWIVLDPLIGCWLLDPDHPVSTFSDVQSQLKAKELKKISTSNVMGTSCDMLIQLSLTTKKLQNLLEEKNLWKIFVDMEMKILMILAGMEFNGLSVDLKILKKFAIILKEKLEIIEKKAYKSIGRPFQINSTVQLRSILYDELKLDVKNGIEVQQTTTRGAKSTSESMLQLLQKLHPLPGLVLEYRHLSKVKSTYVDAMIQHVRNGIIYSTWEQTSAATGRIASSNPNLQSIPKQPFPLSLFPENVEENEESILHLRSAYISRPGYSLLAADFNHIEFRVFAHLSEDKAIIQALNEPEDIFITLTKTWLGNNTEEISKKQREETKRLVYATMYGAGAAKIAGILKIPLQEATNVIKNFTSKFPGLKEFSRITIELCRKQGYLRSLSGRSRLFPNINNPILKIKAQAERQAINFRIQASAADICKSAMIMTQEHLKGFKCKLLLQIHDELVWEVLDKDIPNVQVIVKRVMEDTTSICGKIVKFSVPLTVSVSVGKNWSEMKEC